MPPHCNGFPAQRVKAVTPLSPTLRPSDQCHEMPSMAWGIQLVPSAAAVASTCHSTFPAPVLQFWAPTASHPCSRAPVA